MKYRAQLGEESGLTLVELLIAAALFLVISLVVFNVINSFGMAQNTVLAKAQGTSDGMVVFNQVTRDIRNAQIPLTGPVVTYPTGLTANSTTPTNEIELNTSNPDGSAAVVCIIVQNAAAAVNSTACPITAASTPALNTTCPCTLTAYNVGATNTLRYRVYNLTTANIFTLVTPPTGTTPQTVDINAAFQPKVNEPAVSIQSTIELRNVAISS